MSDYVRQTYYLDSPIKSNSIVTIIVTSNKKDPSATGYLINDKLYEWNFTTKSTGINDGVANLYGVNIGGTYNTTGEEVYGKVYYESGKIELYFDAPPSVEGVDNIIIEFEADEKKLLYRTYNFRFEMEHTGILFFNGDAYNYSTGTYETFLCFTEVGNKLYIPAENYINSEYTGMIPLTDNTLGLFTNRGITYLVRSEETIGSDIKYTYRNYIGQKGEIAIAKQSIDVLSNDPLFLSANGVYAMKMSENIKSNERYAIERSSFINSYLTKHTDLSNAKAIVYKNRYYLAIDDIVYIADARYKKAARDSDMDDSFNYEWWIWNDIPVKKWLIINNKLMYLNKDDELCEFVEERRDSKIIPLSSYGNSMGYFTAISTSQYNYQFDSTKIELLKEGNIIEMYTVNDSKKYIIRNVNLSKGTFNLQKYEDDGTDIYIDNAETIFGASDDEGYRYSVYMIDKSNVVSEWYTPIINMGTSLYSKNLLSSTLVFEPNIEGEVKYGYLTRRKNETIFKNSALSPSNGVDFEDIDFTDFSFAVGFAVSRTLKTRVRNFNFIQFRIISDTNKDCALNNFTITYNIGRKNKGVR